jgi:DNA-binding NarL/FixJ family response regulator
MTYDSLTPRQWQVIDLVSKGLKNQEIALQMGITRLVVTNYLRVIMDLTGMNSRLELAMWYVRRQ